MLEDERGWSAEGDVRVVRWGSRMGRMRTLVACHGADTGDDDDDDNDDGCGDCSAGGGGDAPEGVGGKGR